MCIPAGVFPTVVTKNVVPTVLTRTVTTYQPADPVQSMMIKHSKCWHPQLSSRWPYPGQPDSLHEASLHFQTNSRWILTNKRIDPCATSRESVRIYDSQIPIYSTKSQHIYRPSTSRMLVGSGTAVIVRDVPGDPLHSHPDK